MPREKSRKKISAVTIRFDATELERIRRAAKAASRSLNNFVAHAAFQKAIQKNETPAQRGEG